MTVSSKRTPVSLEDFVDERKDRMVKTKDVGSISSMDFIVDHNIEQPF